MEYLKDGLQAWESSLEGYRRHQAALQEAAATARADIATARQAIEMNAKAAEDPSAPRIVMAQPIREEIEEAGQEEQLDQEEEKLRSSLQSVLTACAGSLWDGKRITLEHTLRHHFRTQPFCITLEHKIKHLMETPPYTHTSDLLTGARLWKKNAFQSETNTKNLLV